MVYVVRALAGEASGLVKIGCTRKVEVPDCRLREVASSRLVRGPIDVLWGKIATGRLERELHEWFAPFHRAIGGEREWFSLSDEDLGLLLAIDSDLPRGVLTPRLRKTG
jgi:hypothetical protein